MANSNYTLVVTSCDRHDLLKNTLDSFIAHVDQQPFETIIIEDSAAAMPQWLREGIHDYGSRLGKVKWIANDGRLGQIYSIDRAYRDVRTDYIFHCEDDWEFQGRDFIAESKAILERYLEIVQVSLRGDTGWHQLIDWSYPFKIAMPYWHGHWGGIAFNPGLRRLADWREIGSYGRHVAYGTHGLGHEAQLSKMFLDQGRRIADLNRPIVVHTGDGRSRAAEPLAAMPRILIAVPACHRMEYGAWESEQSPLYDPGKAWMGQPYGTDIHITGPNDRIAAVRETWAKDIAPFAAHVTLKFCYGTPAPPNWHALDDEVQLACPDDYAGLPAKSVAIVRFALDGGYDFLFKCDDDTAVYVDRLVSELMSGRWDYAGCAHHRVCTGGPGYWLSKRAMKAVLANVALGQHWAEDVTVARSLLASDIYPEYLSGHKPGGSSHWFFGDKFDATKLLGDEVTMHALRPADMRAWHAHVRAGK